MALFIKNVLCRDAKKHMTSPSPRSSTVLSNSYQPTNPDYSRAESESGASTMSETPEVFTRSLKLVFLLKINDNT